MSCHHCGADAPTKHVSLHQNIGMLIMRQAAHVEGELCRRCIDSHFWRFTLTTIAIGWFGVISLIVAPIYVVNNIYQFIRTRSLPDAYPTARATKATTTTTLLTPEARAKLLPFRDELRQRIERGEEFADATFAVARKAGVSAAQVEAFAESLAEAA